MQVRTRSHILAGLMVLICSPHLVGAQIDAQFMEKVVRFQEQLKTMPDAATQTRETRAFFGQFIDSDARFKALDLMLNAPKPVVPMALVPEILAPGLKDRDVYVRAEALRLLSQAAQAPDMHHLVWDNKAVIFDLLKRPQPKLWTMAFVAIGASHDIRFASHIRPFLTNTDASVRGLAARTAGSVFRPDDRSLDALDALER